MTYEDLKEVSGIVAGICGLFAGFLGMLFL